MRTSNVLDRLILGFLAAGTWQVAAAQDGTSAMLEEVVVSAQKREESLQSVPVSVTALTGNTLESMQLDSPSSFAAQIPNLQVNGIVGSGSPLFSLRGISMFDFSLSQSAPVASYLDEVYKGNFVLFGVEMYDLERVEVLRGPQGTLYGKNTTGGAINFITRRPGYGTEGYVKVGAGNYGRIETEGAIQGALVPDKLAARLAYTYTKVDGFVKNVLPGQPDMEGVDQYGARLSLLYEPNDQLDLILRVAASKQRPRNYAIIVGRINDLGVGFSGYYRTQDGTATGVPLKNDEIAMDYTPRRRQENASVSLTANIELSDRYSITSITSWDRGKLFNPEGTDGSPIEVFKIEYFGRTRQWTQDLRLSTTDDGPFQFILGAYYSNENIFNTNENRIFNFLDYNGDNALTFQDCVDSSYGTPGGGYEAGAFINLSCRYYNQFDQIRNSWAAYSDASYAISDRVKLRAGIRYTEDRGKQKNAIDQVRGIDGIPIASLFSLAPNCVAADPTVLCPVLALPGSTGYDAIVNATGRQSLHNTNVSGRVGIDFTPTDDSLIYVNVGRGYRSAAFNAQFLFSPSDFTTVKPEKITSMEAGFKSKWLAGRLQLNGAVFHYRYKNQQIINVFPTGEQPLINLGKSRIYGGELELVTRPVSSLTFRVGAGFLDTKVQRGTLSVGDISGNELPNAPKVSGTAAIDWDAWTGSAATVALHVDTTYSSRQFLALPNDRPISQAAYALLNARVAVRGPDDRWEVGVWGNNLTDKFFLTSAVNVQGLGFDYRHRGAPRMYGVDATYRF